MGRLDGGLAQVAGGRRVENLRVSRDGQAVQLVVLASINFGTPGPAESAGGRAARRDTGQRTASRTECAHPAAAADSRGVSGGGGELTVEECQLGGVGDDVDRLDLLTVHGEHQNAGQLAVVEAE